MLVMIDSRESKDNIDTYKSVLSTIDDSLIINTAELETGDINFVSKETGDLILSAEIKHDNDFISSIIDGRLAKQSSRMLELTQNRFIVLTGDFDFTDSKMNPSAVYGMIASLNQSGFRFIKDYDVLVAIEILTRTALKIKKLGNTVTNFEFLVKTEKNPVLTYLRSIPSISDKLASNIINKFELTSLEGLLKLDAVDLQEVPRIGLIKAENIVKAIKG